MLSFLWSLRQKHLSAEMVEADTFLLCWAAKWSDGTTIHSRVASPKEARDQDDARLVESLAELVRKADYVVAHNGNRFDVPVLNGRLMVNGGDPLGNVQTIDTLLIARQSFRLASNKLDYLAQQLGIGEKQETDFDLWRDCYRGDKKALSRMVEYNRHDVYLLEEVFHRLLPYAKSLPRLFDSPEWRQDDFCPSCGSKERTLSETQHRSKVSNWRKWKCGGCGREYRHWQAIGSRRSGSVGL